MSQLLKICLDTRQICFEILEFIVQVHASFFSSCSERLLFTYMLLFVYIEINNCRN